MNGPTNPTTLPDDAPEWSLRDRRGLLAAAALLLVYVALRLAAFQSALWVEDHDSISYLVHMDRVMRDGLSSVWRFGPDTTPFYPVAGALFGALSGSTEIGARLASLFFSILMLAALFDIGRRVATPVSVAAGLLLVAFNPLLIQLSYAVLTEPSFVATFYVALWIFWTQYREPKLKLAALLGLVAGLAFINRLEGILYLAFFPTLQAIHFFVVDGRSYDKRRLASWTAIFVVSFAVLAVPQVWKVSEQMGRLALNGRQAWVAMLNEGDQGYEETIYGLEYDPGTVNLDYIQSNPDALGQVQSDASPLVMARTIVLNLDSLFSERLSQLLGAAVLALFGLGMVDLWSRGLKFEAFLVVATIGVGVAAPLAHNVVPRHVAVIVPIILLTAGMGAGLAGRVLASGGLQSAAKSSGLLTALVTVAALCTMAYPLSVILRGLDRPNTEYHPDDFVEPLGIVRDLAESELDGNPVIITRKSYFAYYAGGGSERLHLPHTDYEGLVTYSRVNDVDFLFLEHDSLASERPFMSAFTDDDPPRDFELLYSGVSGLGERIDLYRFLDHAGGAE